MLTCSLVSDGCSVVMSSPFFLQLSLVTPGHRALPTRPQTFLSASLEPQPPWSGLPGLRMDAGWKSGLAQSYELRPVSS
jgi:hypothetical protein